MNQLKKLFTILIFACYIIAADKSYKIVSTDIQSFIKQDGSIDFIENREFDFTGSYTYVYQDIPKKGFDAEPGFSSIAPVCGDIIIPPVSVCHQVSTIGH